MAGPLKIEKHERFAQELAKGTLQKVAYATAGYRGGENHASRLAARGDVKARVAEILGRAAARTEVTIGHIAQQLDEDRTLAHSTGQAGAAVSASLGKAKVLGLLPDRHEMTGKGGGPIEYRNLDEDEIDARLRALQERNAERDRPLAH
jgi:hypothetical protein